MVEIKLLSIDTLLKEASGLGSECEQVSSGLEASFKITELGEPLEVGSSGLCFIISESFLKEIAQSKAAVFVVNKTLLDKAKENLSSRKNYCLISSTDAYLALAHLSSFLAKQDSHHDWSVTQDKIATTSELHSTVVLGSGVSVGPNTKIGARTILYPNVSIGPNVTIGEDCVLFPGVVIYPRTQIGSRVRLHANVVLGSDGFGYAKSKMGSVKIWHLGKVKVGNDVEIGAGSSIDRGTIKDTIVENGVKIDNLVQIGHNVRVKAHAILCAQVGLAGNAIVGMGAILAGKAGVADKVEIGDGAIIGPMCGLSKDVKAGEIFMGQQPGKPRREWWRLIAHFERLPELFDRVKKLEKATKE